MAYNALLTAGSSGSAAAAVEAQRATRDIYAQQFDLGSAACSICSIRRTSCSRLAATWSPRLTETFMVYRVLAVIGMMLDTLDIDRPKEAINIYRQPTPPEYPTAPVNARR